MKQLTNLTCTAGHHYKGVLEFSARHKKHLRDSHRCITVVIPEHETVEFDTLIMRDVGMPILHKSGNILIRNLIALDFTADLFNSPGNITIENLIAVNDKAYTAMKHYKRYHQDVLGQFFSNRQQIVRNVKVQNIEAIIHGAYTQGMALTEGWNRYTDFRIGTGNVNIDMQYRYALTANTLDNSYLNLGKGTGIRIKKVKASKFNSGRVIIQKNEDQEIVTDFEHTLK